MNVLTKKSNQIFSLNRSKNLIVKLLSSKTFKVFSAILLGIFAFNSNSSAQCNYSLELSDSWGDGWNNNLIEVTTGANIDTLTLASGSFQAVPLTVNTGDSIRLFYLGGGSYNSEVSFELKDVGGSVLYSSGAGPSVGFHYSVTANCPSCLPPTSLGVSGLSQTNAFAIWQVGGSETSWDIEYDTVGFTQGTGTMATASSTQYYIQNLIANSSYSFYVRANCGGVTSPWAGPYTFFTGYCTPAPSSQDGSGITNVTFGSINNSTGSEPGYYGDYSSMVSSHPQTTAVNLDIEYSTGYTYGTKIWVDWNDDLDFDDQGELVYTGLSASTNPTVLNTTFNVPSSAPLGNHRLRIGGTDNNSGPSSPCYTGSYGSFEDYTINVTTAPTCAQPSMVMDSIISPTSVQLAWMAGGSETAWDLEWGVTGFTQGSGTVTALQSNPHTLTGLMSNTMYSYYLRANCGNNDLSPWVGPFSFMTPCAAFTAPYAQNFDGTTDPEIDPCWQVANFTGSTSPWIRTENSTADPNRSAPNSIEFYSSSNTTSDLLLLVSPMFSDLDNTKRVRFYVQDKGSSSYVTDLFVGVMSDPTDSSTFTPLDTIFKSELSGNWLEVAVNLPSGLGNYVAIGQNRTGTFDYIWLDDFYYENIPSCFKPSNIRTTSISPTSASLSWTASNYPNNWEVMYEAMGSGSANSVFVSDTMTTLSNLMASTPYSAMIREICGSGDTSAWEGPYNFTTPCFAINTFPYVENFDAVAATPACWGQDPNNAENWLINTGSSATYGGQGSDHTTGSGNFAWIDDSSPHNAAPSVLESPAFDLSGLTAPRLRYWFTNRGTSSSGNESKFYIHVYNGSSWVVADSIVGVPYSSWTEFTLDLTAYKSSNSKIRFVVFEDPSSFYSDVSIDDIYVEETPSCFKPSNVRATNVLATSVSLEWTPDNYPNNWEVRYDTNGVMAGSTFASDSMATVTGLMGNTNYTFFVREICNAGDTSYWEGPLSLLTPCLAIQAPYVETFDQLPLVSPYTMMPPCWDPQTGPDYWDVTNDLTNTGHSYLPNIGDHTTGSGNYMWIDASGDITGNEMVSPMLDLSGLSSPWAGFWFASNNTNNNVNHTIALDVWDGSAWMTIATETGNFSGWVPVKGRVPSSIPSTTKFRIHAIAATGTTSSTYYYNDLGVDDFWVNDVPLSVMAGASMPMACEGDTVYMAAMADGGSGTYTYSWSPMTMMSNSDTTMFIADTSVAYVVTANDGNTTAMDTVMVYVSPTATISLSVAEGDPFCDQVKLEVESDMPVAYYFWSNANFGPVYYPSGNLPEPIAVTAMDSMGCESNTATFMYDPSKHLENYTIVANDYVELNKNNRVLKGAIGIVKKNNGRVVLGPKAGIVDADAFISAPILNARSSSYYPIHNSGKADVQNLKDLRFGSNNGSNQPAGRKVVGRGQTQIVRAIDKDIIVKPFSTAILIAGRYNDIVVEKGGTVVFDFGGQVRVNNLILKDGKANAKTVAAAGSNTLLKVAESVKVGSNCIVAKNSNDFDIVIGNNANRGLFRVITERSIVDANIFVPNGVFKTYGSSTQWSIIAGKVVADSVMAFGQRTRWFGSSCSQGGVLPPVSKSAEVAQEVVNETEKSVVSVSNDVTMSFMPNPTNGNITLQLNGLSNLDNEVTVQILTLEGKVVYTQQLNTSNGYINQPISLEGVADGFYFMNVTAGENTFNEKLILTR
jgi:hypothetical protein